MHAIYLLLICTVNAYDLQYFNEHGGYPRHTSHVQRSNPLYKGTATTSACSHDTDGTTGTCNGSPTSYMPSSPSSAIKIPSFV